MELCKMSIEKKGERIMDKCPRVSRTHLSKEKKREKGDEKRTSVLRASRAYLPKEKVYREK
jgi:hypothetical protein